MTHVSLDDITTVRLVDDNAEGRKGFGYTVTDADLLPIDEIGPLLSIDDFLAAQQPHVAVLSDYELRAKDYAAFTGADLVKRLQQTGTPAILCTRFEQAQIDRIRPSRRWIPVLMTPDELDPESLTLGLGICAAEIRGEFTAARRPWPTQAHFFGVDPEDESSLFVEIPGWDVSEMIRVKRADLPAEINALASPGFRCRADVNLGTDSPRDIYMHNWRLDE